MRTLLCALLLLGCATSAFAEQRAPWVSTHQTGNTFLDTQLGAIPDTLLMQASCTTQAILVWDCQNMTALVGGSGADSVNMVVQQSLNGTDWTTFTTGNTAISNVSFANYTILRNVLATNPLSTGTAWTGSTPNRYVRVIVKNNCDATQAQTANVLRNISIGVVGACR